MAGMDAVSGKTLDELADIRQSISDIVGTPVGTRVMRRAYGSHLFDLVDSPGSPEGALQVVAAAADAIARFEKRVVMQSANLTVSYSGEAVLRTTCKVKASGLTITADTKIAGAA
ncbi:MAG TPA: GPW/gp25 family protein [Candidatus Sulfotelmatobacter sp.]|jgi:phage baseplate assembly protein W|nr:GPW/gp25 family protein [Candidatus Sulfotelmatobacter sp.]